MGVPGNTAPAGQIGIFEKRYFLWALEDAERDAASDFQLLRRLPCRRFKTFLDVTASLSEDERISLMRARVMNGHSISTTLKYEPTQHEAALLKYSFQYVREQICSGRGWFSGFPLKVPKKEFKAVLRSALDKAEIGEYDPWDVPNGWRYVLTKGPYTVYTHIDVSGTNRQLWYYHAIHLREVPFYEWISFTTWLGLGPTYFDLVPRDGTKEAAETLRILCQRFVSALNQLLP
jgi:hypothetical protein